MGCWRDPHNFVGPWGKWVNMERCRMYACYCSEHSLVLFCPARLMKRRELGQSSQHG